MSSIFRFSWKAKLLLLMFAPSIIFRSTALIDERSGKNLSKFHSRNNTASSFSEVVDVDDPVVATEVDDWLARFYFDSVSFRSRIDNDQNDN